MAAADEAKQAVEAAETRCGEAVSAAVAAQTVADDRVNWAADLGLAAMAELVQRAADVLIDAAQWWGTTAAGCQAAGSMLAMITQDSASAAVLDQVRTSGEKLIDAHTSAQTAATKTDDARVLATPTEITDLTNATIHASTQATAGVAAVAAAIRGAEAYQRQVQAALEAVAGSQATGTPGPCRRPDLQHRLTYRQQYRGWPSNFCSGRKTNPHKPSFTATKTAPRCRLSLVEISRQVMAD